MPKKRQTNELGELLCTKCKRHKAPEEFSRRKNWGSGRESQCKECVNSHQSERYLTDSAFRERRKAIDRRGTRKEKDAAIVAYGGACSCCGERRREFMTVDHIDGNGAEHRRQLHKEMGWSTVGGRKFYRWLRLRGYPKDNFRLLCWNCNSARGTFGYCPHEKERECQQSSTSCPGQGNPFAEPSSPSTQKQLFGDQTEASMT